MFNPPAHKSNSAGQLVNPIEESFRPPRYLRDVIKAAQERSSEEPKHLGATTPSTDAEKRLERLTATLRRLCDGADKRLQNGWWPNEIRKILKENT